MPRPFIPGPYDDNSGLVRDILGEEYQVVYAVWKKIPELTDLVRSAQDTVNKDIPDAVKNALQEISSGLDDASKKFQEQIDCANKALEQKNDELFTSSKKALVDQSIQLKNQLADYSTVLIDSLNQQQKDIVAQGTSQLNDTANNAINAVNTAAQGVNDRINNQIISAENDFTNRLTALYNSLSNTLNSSTQEALNSIKAAQSNIQIIQFTNTPSGTIADAPLPKDKTAPAMLFYVIEDTSHNFDEFKLYSWDILNSKWSNQLVDIKAAKDGFSTTLVSSSGNYNDCFSNMNAIAIEPNTQQLGIYVVTDSINNVSYRVLSRSSSGSWTFLADIKNGNKGDKGDKGDQGIQGPKGDVGPQGIQGEQGPKGDKGDKGDAGTKGDNGSVAIGTEKFVGDPASVILIYKQSWDGGAFHEEDLKWPYEYIFKDIPIYFFRSDVQGIPQSNPLEQSFSNSGNPYITNVSKTGFHYKHTGLWPGNLGETLLTYVVGVPDYDAMKANGWTDPGLNNATTNTVSPSSDVQFGISANLPTTNSQKGKLKDNDIYINTSTGDVYSYSSANNGWNKSSTLNSSSSSTNNYNFYNTEPFYFGTRGSVTDWSKNPPTTYTNGTNQDNTGIHIGYNLAYNTEGNFPSNIVQIGSNSSASGTAITIIGTAATALDNSTSIGYNALCSYSSIAIGNNSAAGNDTVAIGISENSRDAYNTISIGTEIGSMIATTPNSFLEQLGNYSTAIGHNSRVINDYTLSIGAYSYSKGKNSIAIGAGSVAQDDNTVSFGYGQYGNFGSSYDTAKPSPNNFNIPQYRRLVNIANGLAATDAATVGQVTPPGTPILYPLRANSIPNGYIAFGTEVNPVTAPGLYAIYPNGQTPNLGTVQLGGETFIYITRQA